MTTRETARQTRNIPAQKGHGAWGEQDRNAQRETLAIHEGDRQKKHYAHRRTDREAGSQTEKKTSYLWCLVLKS